MLLCVWDEGERAFPSTQRYYHRFLLFIIHLTATCFDDHIQAEISAWRRSYDRNM
jgi:hypothetical protein